MIFFAIHRIHRRLLSIAGLLAVSVSAVLGQNAQLSGKVSDSSGAVVPGVQITITNLGNGAERSLSTNESGLYVAPSLQPGQYRLSALKTGFKPAVRDGLTLQVSDNVELDLKLEVGSASAEEVTVTADIALLRTDDAETGEVIDNRRIEELPQYNRNILAFAHLDPAVSGSAENQQVQQGGGESDFRISGGRTTGSEYYIDGIPVTEGYSRGVPPSVPAPEAVQEFKVISSGLSAEYGRVSGGVVTIVTRSGSNQFHGSAFEFVKNDLFNANDYFSNLYGKPKGTFHNNIFGGSFGGPVWLPKLYNGRNKSFFFLSYEGNRYSGSSNSSMASVPTEAERNGDFSASTVEYNGSIIPAQIYDPASGVRQSDGSVIRQQFSYNGQLNVIPPGRIDAIAKIYNSYYPLPNQAPQSTNHSNNYIGTSWSISHYDKWTGRFDQTWSPRNLTYFTVATYDDFNGNPGWLGPLSASSSQAQSAKTGSLHHLFTLNTATILEANLGVVRDTGPAAGSVGTTGYSSLSSSVDSSKWGFSSNVYDIMGTTVGRAPDMYTQGDVADLGGGGGALTYETDYHAGVSLQKLLGRQNLKFGWQGHRYYTNQYTGGGLQFTSDPTITQFNPLSSDGTGTQYASFLLGLLAGAYGNQWAGPASLQTAYDLYGQDSIKFSSKLTAGVGVRWDYEPPRTERFNREIFWDSKYKWDVSPAPGWSWQNVLAEAGVTDSIPEPAWMTQGFLGRPAVMGSKEYPHRTIQDNQAYHFSPHLGVAYQVRPNTVVRASYGFNWLSVLGNRWLNGSWNNGYGDAIAVEQSSPDGGLTYPSTLADPTPNGSGFQQYIAGNEQLALNTALGQWYLAQAVDTSVGFEQNFQIAVQQQIGSGAKAWVLELNGSGTLGRNLQWGLGKGEEIMQNAYNLIGKEGMKLYQMVDNPVYGSVPTQYGAWANAGPTTQLGRVLENNPLYGEAWVNGEGGGTSNYFQGYIQAEHRFGSGYSLLSSYTYSKLLQDIGGNFTGTYAAGNGETGPYDENGYPQAGLGLSDVYGVAPNDRTHRFLVNFSYDLPFGRGKRFLSSPSGLGGAVLDRAVGGWTIAGTGTYWSGMPESIGGNIGDGFWAGIGQGRNQMRAVFLNQNYNNHVSGHKAIWGPNGAVGTAYFNPASFGQPQEQGIGNVPVTMPDFRGPGYSAWDLAMMKDFALWSESSKLQLRAEAQNAMNHMNCANPDNQMGSGTFGYVVQQHGSPRVMMLAAKIIF
jgi:hypothetical protein